MRMFARQSTAIRSIKPHVRGPALFTSDPRTRRTRKVDRVCSSDRRTSPCRTCRTDPGCLSCVCRAADCPRRSCNRCGCWTYSMRWSYGRRKMKTNCTDAGTPNKMAHATAPPRSATRGAAIWRSPLQTVADFRRIT